MSVCSVLSDPEPFRRLKCIFFFRSMWWADVSLPLKYVQVQHCIDESVYTVSRRGTSPFCIWMCIADCDQWFVCFRLWMSQSVNGSIPFQRLRRFVEDRGTSTVNTLLVSVCSMLLFQNEPQCIQYGVHAPDWPINNHCHWDWLCQSLTYTSPYSVL